MRNLFSEKDPFFWGVLFILLCFLGVAVSFIETPFPKVEKAKVPQKSSVTEVVWKGSIIPIEPQLAVNTAIPDDF